MTLIPKPKKVINLQPTKPKTIPQKTKLTPENYEKLRRLTGSGFTRIYKTN